VRILYLIDGLQAGGKERQAVSLLRGLAQQGVEILVVCMGEYRFFSDFLVGSNIRFQPMLRRHRWDPGIFVKLNQLLREFKPDLLHTNCWMTSFYALPLGKLRGTPLVNGSIRNAFDCGGLRWRMERILMQLSDARIANSRAGLCSRGFPVDGARNYVVHNGFDFARLSQLDSQGKQKLQILVAGRRVVGMVAEFRDNKDYSTYLEAARLILRKRSDVAFVAVGDGKNLEELRKRYETKDPGILFLGRQNSVESVVNGFEIGVLTTYTEGISNSVMEYMALGKPVVVTDGGGTSELIRDDEEGFLVPPSDPKLVAEKIEILLDDPAKAKAMGVAGRRRLEENFSIERLVENYLRMYKEVLGAVN
jgi:glycosyltransferase involved in cell wall biosynthesis